MLLLQHAGVHAHEGAGRPTLADRVFDVTDEQMRVRPLPGLNSLVWLMWHMARVEDVAVSLVVAARPQVHDADWLRRMGTGLAHMGSGMTSDEVDALTAGVDVRAVRAYRAAVGQRTREVARALAPAQWEEMLALADTTRAAHAGAFGPRDHWTDDGGHPPWQGRPRITQLAASAIGHNALHLGEALTIRSLAGFPLDL